MACLLTEPTPMMWEGNMTQKPYFSNLKFDVAISAIPTTNKLILIGTGISWSPKNIKIALLRQNIIPLINLIKLKFFLSIICIINY